jgi:hypothetical protein
LIAIKPFVRVHDLSCAAMAVRANDAAIR